MEFCEDNLPIIKVTSVLMIQMIVLIQTLQMSDQQNDMKYHSLIVKMKVKTILIMLENDSLLSQELKLKTAFYKTYKLKKSAWCNFCV